MSSATKLRLAYVGLLVRYSLSLRQRLPLLGWWLPYLQPRQLLRSFPDVSNLEHQELGDSVWMKIAEKPEKVGIIQIPNSSLHNSGPRTWLAENVIKETDMMVKQHGFLRKAWPRGLAPPRGTSGRKQVMNFRRWPARPDRYVGKFPNLWQLCKNCAWLWLVFHRKHPVSIVSPGLFPSRIQRHKRFWHHLMLVGWGWLQEILASDYNRPIQTLLLPSVYL